MPLAIGPFALPMTDRQAFALEAKLKEMPRDQAPRRLPLASGAAPQPEGRSDISWISTESPDRQGDIVLAGGMDDSHFQLNPIVTLNHDYARSPVGRSLWRKPMSERGLAGIKAKTYYPPRPAGWGGEPWLPDLAYGLLRAGLLNGKSIGFLPLKVRAPTREEVCREPRLVSVRAIVEKWLLLEYACCFLPVQPNAVVLEREGAQALAASTACVLQLRQEGSDHHRDTRAPGVMGRDNISSQLITLVNSAAFDRLVEKSLQRTYQRHLGIV